MATAQVKPPSIVASVKAARRVSVPLVAIATPDPAATIEAVCASLKEAVPQIIWDLVGGLRPANEAGRVAAANLGLDDFSAKAPDAMLTAARNLVKESVLFVHMANRLLDSPLVIQAIWNLRDQFKRDRRTLVLLGPSIDLPPELAGDVVVFDEPLPDAAELSRIIVEQFASAQSPPPGQDVLVKATEAVQGLPAFQAEQVVAMSLDNAGLNVPALWERKRRQIELTPGLKVQRDAVTFADVGGVETIKGFLKNILAASANARPNAIVFIDEIEKFLAGATGSGGDSSGVSQDQLGTLLGYMQDQAAVGCIFVGPPGSAKSAIAKAAGNEAGIPTIQLDPGAMKGSLVGQSEQNLRAALKVITSVSNGRSLWIATCNAIGDLPPELRRRFTLGTFFFDLPDAFERKAIWRIWLKRYGLGDVAKAERLKQLASENPAALNDDGWTGAEIKQCCDIAWRLGFPLADAARFVVPVSRSAAEQVERLRKAAEGRFLSATYPGVYRRSDPADQPKGRRLATEEE